MSDEERLDDYSRGRADAEIEYKENLSMIRGLIEALKEDDNKKKVVYQQEKSNKIMRSYYSGKSSAFYEVISIFDFMEIEKDD
jgi:hypothetical protein